MLKWIARLGRTDSKPTGFLGRLRRDIRGNTLAIVGAALVPITAMIGSGVDMSRAYMARTRLQSACDSAALAGRRVMQNDTVNQTVIDEARRFFNFNFNQGLYNTAAFTPAVTRASQGTVRVTASTTIPTTIMRMFGFTTLPLDVTCDASLNFVNTDVMLVLDTTGSMDWDVNGNTTSVDANRRITALRDAVMALYDELAPIQTQLEANGLRLRYGLVPYSSTVNVGRLISRPSVINMAPMPAIPH
jgi:Flp pilus assembly protein TadG